MLTHAASCIQTAIDAGVFPSTVNPHVAMHVLWAALLGPSVVGIRHRLAPGEDYDALARDVLETVISGLRTGARTTFIPCECVGQEVAHES